MTNLGVIPPTVRAMGLAGWRFALAPWQISSSARSCASASATMPPSMALLAFLECTRSRLPIMIASDGVLNPVASLDPALGRFAPAVAVGLTLGGIVGTIALLVQHLGITSR